MGGVASVSGAIVIGRTGCGDGATGGADTGAAACTRFFAHPAVHNEIAQTINNAELRTAESWLGIYRFSAA
jgi:hypothetical protein